jgi:hypothetical protein
MQNPEIRYITHIKKASNLDVIEICNPGQPWSPVSKKDAIHDIVSKTYQYLVNWGDFTTEIKVVVSNINYKYLRTDKDGSARNNLEELPNCY